MKMSKRNVPANVSDVVTTATAAILLFPLLFLTVLTSYDPTGFNMVEAFVTPGGSGRSSSIVQRLSNVRETGPGGFEFASPLLSRPTGTNSGIDLPRASFRFWLHSTQQYREREREQQQDYQHCNDGNEEEDPNEEANNHENEERSAVEQLLLDAERLRLEAEQMDATLTLRKIAALEEKLSNDAWLKKQKGQTVKDLYEELRMLERKVSHTVSNNGNDNGNGGYSSDRELPSSTTLTASSSSPRTSSSSTAIRAPENRNYSGSSSERLRHNNKQKKSKPATNRWFR